MGEIALWLIIAVLVIIIDFSTSAFLFIWFSIGSIAAIVANLLGFNFAIQFLVFVIVSCISVAIGYPWFKKKYKKGVKHIPLMEETYIGKILVAEELIEEETRIKVAGIYWGAINKGQTINKGEKFVIKRIEGNKFIIEKVEEDK